MRQVNFSQTIKLLFFLLAGVAVFGSRSVLGQPVQIVLQPPRPEDREGWGLGYLSIGETAYEMIKAYKDAVAERKKVETKLAVLEESANNLKQALREKTTSNQAIIKEQKEVLIHAKQKLEEVVAKHQALVEEYAETSFPWLLDEDVQFVASHVYQSAVDNPTLPVTPLCLQVGVGRSLSRLREDFGVVWDRLLDEQQSTLLSYFVERAKAVSARVNSVEFTRQFDSEISPLTTHLFSRAQLNQYQLREPDGSLLTVYDHVELMMNQMLVQRQSASPALFQSMRIRPLPIEQVRQAVLDGVGDDPALVEKIRSHHARMLTRAFQKLEAHINGAAIDQQLVQLEARGDITFHR